MHPRLIHMSVGLLSMVVVLAHVEASAAAGAGLHGRILGLDNDGRYVGVVPGATIEFVGQGGAAVQTTSAANGYYRIDLPAGVYAYRVKAAGYRTEDDGRGLELRQTDGHAVHDFSLVRGQDEEKPFEPEVVPVGELTGRIFEIVEQQENQPDTEGREAERPASGQDSVRGAAGPQTSAGQRRPCTRVRIVLGGKGRYKHWRRVIVRWCRYQQRDTGTFKIALPAGEWTASVSAEGYAQLVDPEPIVITAGQTTTRDFGLRRLEPVTPTDQGIKGVVILPPDTARPPIRVRIEPLLSPGAALPTVTPDAQGRFVRNLPAGHYRVRAEAEGFHPASRVPVSVFEGRYTQVSLRLKPLAEPEPTPTPAPTPSPTPPTSPLRVLVNVQERTEAGLVPIPKARVLLRRDGDPVSQAARSDTDSQGSTSFKVDSGGNFLALAQAEGFKPGGLRLHVGQGEPNRADIILIRSTPDIEEQLVVVSGYVAYKDSTSSTGLRSIPGTRLTWRESRQGQTVQRTDSDNRGAFRLEIPAGRYEVELQPPRGFQGAKVEVAVTAGMGSKTFILEHGRPDDERIEPTRAVQVAGLVISAPLVRTGRYVSVPDATITWDGPQVDRTTRSDLSGRFSVALPPALYNVRVSAPGYDDLRQSVIVQRGMDTVRLVLTRRDESAPETMLPLYVRVMYQAVTPQRRLTMAMPGARTPLANAAVSVLQNGRPVATGRSDRDGRYSTQLRPGQYDIKVTHDNYVPGQARVALTTRAVSTEIVLIPAARPDEQPEGQRTLTLRIVERVLGPDVQPDVKPYTPDKAYIPGRLGTRDSTGPSGGVTGQPAGVQGTRSAASPLERLQERLQRRTQREFPIGDRLPLGIKPVGGAAVVVRQGSRTVTSGNSDSSGLYRVRLDPGTYDVRVTQQGYAPAQLNVRVGAGDVTQQVVLTKERPR